MQTSVDARRSDSNTLRRRQADLSILQSLIRLIARGEADLTGRGTMTATFEQCTDELILAVEGTLRVPLNSGLSERVHALLLGGKRRILLDLGRLDDIDAGGIGELVRALNATNEGGGVLRIAHANSRVHRLLDVAGVLQFMSGDTAHPQMSRLDACG